MNNAELFIKLLSEAFDLRAVHLYPGGTIAPLINACAKRGLCIETYKGEQGAGYAAIGMAIATKMPQVVFVTSGPGVTNVVSCIADAFFDSLPIIFVCGQVGTSDLNSGRLVRQVGFQQCDTVSITKPISKLSVQIQADIPLANQLNCFLEEFLTGRDGPLVIDFPMDIQRSDSILASHSFRVPIRQSNTAKNEHHQMMTRDLQRLFDDCQRPLVLVGGGGTQNQNPMELQVFIEKLGVPVVSSFRGIGVIDTDSSFYLGYLGHTGHDIANLAVATCDLLIVLGSRLDVRQTGTEVEDFVNGKTLISVNSDMSEIDYSRVKLDLALNMEISEFIHSFDARISVTDEWLSQIDHFKTISANDVDSEGNKTSARLVFEQINNCLKTLKRYAVVTGVGNHQHWAARYLAFKLPDRILVTSAGHGTMGFDVPASIGVAQSGDFDKVVCIVGDGSIMHNLAELASIGERQLNILIVVVRNNRLGIVSRFQNYTFGVDYTTSDFDSGNLGVVAEGFGLKSEVCSYESFYEVFRRLLLDSVPSLLIVDINTDDDISPMLMGGDSIGNLVYKQ